MPIRRMLPFAACDRIAAARRGQKRGRSDLREPGFGAEAESA